MANLLSMFNKRKDILSSGLATPGIKTIAPVAPVAPQMAAPVKVAPTVNPIKTPSLNHAIRPVTSPTQVRPVASVKPLSMDKSLSDPFNISQTIKNNQQRIPTNGIAPSTWNKFTPQVKTNLYNTQNSINANKVNPLGEVTKATGQVGGAITNWGAKKLTDLAGGVANTGLYVGDAINRVGAGITGNKAMQDAADEQLTQHFKQSIPGGMVSTAQRTLGEAGGVVNAISKMPEGIALQKAYNEALKNGDVANQNLYKSKMNNLANTVTDYYRKLSPTVTDAAGSWTTPETLAKGDSITPAAQAVGELSPYVIPTVGVVLPNMTLQGVTGAGANLLSQAGSGKPLDWGQAANAGVDNAVMAGVMQVAGKGVKAGKDTFVKGVDDIAHTNLLDTNPLYKQANDTVANLDAKIAAAKAAGADVTTLTSQRIELQAAMDGFRKNELQKGHALIPGKDGKLTIDDSEKANALDHSMQKEASRVSTPQDYINETVDQIWANNKKGAGVEFINNDNMFEPGSDIKKISNNSPFYGAFFDEYGHKPTKKEITNLTRDYLNGEDNIIKYEMYPGQREAFDLISQRQANATLAPQVTKTETPKTVKIFTKSRFNPDSKGGYADYPVIRQEDNIKLYQGSNPGEQRQYWTPNKEYAGQFGEVKEKTGSFYKIDNGNRMTDVYVEVPSKSTPIVTKTETPKLTTKDKILGSAPVEYVFGDKKIVQDAVAKNQKAEQAKVKSSVLPRTDQELSQLQLGRKQTSQEINPSENPTNSSVSNDSSSASIITRIDDSVDGGLDETNVRGFIKNAKSSKKVSASAKAQLTELDHTYEVRHNDELSKTVAKKLADDPAGASQYALGSNSDEGTLATIQLAQSYRKSGRFDLEATIINEKARRLTEAGREIQAASMMDEMSPEAVVLSAAQTIQKYNEKITNPKKLIPELTGKIAKEFSDRATEIGKMAEGRDRNIAVTKLRQDLASLIPSSASSKLITIWKAGLLTSPRTTMRNIIGNTVHGIAEVVKDPIAALNDSLLARSTGNRELTATLQGRGKGAIEGLKTGKDILKYGFDPEHSVEKNGGMHITWKKNKVEQAAKVYTEAVFNWMGAQDKVFYKSAERGSLYDQAGAAAINAGKKGDKAFIQNLVDNPTQQMKLTAVHDAQVAVFQNSNLGSQFASRAKSLLKEHSELAGAGLDVVMPFTGVPSSIAGQVMSYSPIGLLKGIADDYRVLAKKVKPEMIPGLQRKASQEIGRGVVGSGLIGLGVYLTATGLMTGQPKDEAERKQWELEGKQANSVMIGGKWRSINSVGPEALVILAGSKIAKGDDIGTTAAGIGEDFLGQTFLSGVQQPLNALSDPTRYGGTYVSNQIASTIPNIVKDVSKAFDPTQRETKVTGDIVKSTENALKSGIPGLRNTLLPKRDALGNELKQEPTGINAFVDLFNSKTPINNTVNNELDRLFKADQSATPSTLTNKQTLAGTKANLTPEQLDTLEKDTGANITKQFNDLMVTDSYKTASDEDKKKVLDNIVSDVRAEAKTNMAAGLSIQSNSVIDPAKLTKAQESVLKAQGKYYETKYPTLSKSASTILTDYDNQDSTDKKTTWNAKANTDATARTSMQAWIGNKELPAITNEVAKDWADYEKSTKDGTMSKLSASDAKKTILKKVYNSQLSNDEKVITSLSKAEIEAYYNKGDITSDNLKKALAVESQMYDAGLITNEPLAKKLGYAARGYKGSSSGAAKTKEIAAGKVLLAAANDSNNVRVPKTSKSAPKSSASFKAPAMRQYSQSGYKIPVAPTISVKKGIV